MSALGVQKGIGGTDVRAVFRGVGSISKKRPSHHKYKSLKQILLIAYLETSVLKGSKRT